MSASRRTVLWLILASAPWIGGCTSPKVTFLSSRCEAPREGSRLKALLFVSTFEATNLEGEQLVYQVRLFDRDRTPLRSRSGRYKAADGAVAATTTMMVSESPQTFKDVRVSIPAAELGVPPNHLPAFGEVAVLKAGGECIARTYGSVPSLKVTEIMPPLTIKPVSYWFVKVTNPNRLPTLLGPFANRKEADAAVTEGTEPPMQVHADEYFWFVPFYNSNAEQSAILVGPCSREQDAQEIADLVARTPDLVPKGLAAGAPLKIQVQQWLKEREVNQIMSSRPAGTAEGAPAEQPKAKKPASGPRQKPKSGRVRESLSP